MLTWLHHLLNQFWPSHDTTNFFLSYGLFIAIIIILAAIASRFAQRYVVRLWEVVLAKSSNLWSEAILQHRISSKIAHLAPALVFYFFAPSLRRPDYVVTISIVDKLQTIAVLYVVFTLFQVVSKILSAAESVYNQREISKRRPIKSYIQVAQIIVALVAMVVGISTILDESPLVFLTSLGAATALIGLVFRDSILGFIASIQLTSYDMLRIGDWIEMPSFSANGDVIEVSLGTVKVRNFDKTITTIPTYALLSNGMKNWRGMKESGGRRIKRSFKVDVRSLKFCDNQLLSKVKEAPFYAEVAKSLIENLDPNELTNGNITNLGLFRRYLTNYCKHLPTIHNRGFTLMVRELEATEMGLPIQIYIFTTDTRWAEHELIQADLFDHIFCAMPYFSLRPYQRSAADPSEPI